MRFALLALALLALLALTTPARAATATLTWTDSDASVMGFNVERKAALCPDAGAFAPLGSVAAAVFTYADPAVVPGGKYCYRVNAWNTIDGTLTGTKQYSPWSNTAGITINFPPPSVAPSQLGVTQTP